MDVTDINLIRRCVPQGVAFPYYPDRESAWGLAQAMPGDTRVGDLKQTATAKFLTRPLLKPLIAGSGGLLRHRDVLALAHADRAMGWPGLTATAQTALQNLYGAPWFDFELTLTSWGTRDSEWRWNQISRRGGNLVLQLGFPSDHAELMGRYLPHDSRKDFEFYLHPIRETGRPTLAWARLDVDMDTGTALIEEVQSDWLREVSVEVEHLTRHVPRSRALARTKAYEDGLKARYEKLWPKVMMLATLHFLRQELGCRDIYMPTPDTGAALKHISGTRPPRSLYTRLPKAFAFAPVTHAPHFLTRPRRRILRHLGRKSAPLFWHLRL